MLEKIELPDIGDFDEVEIIEILVNVGDSINIDDSIITLESDKASMEIPAPISGVVTDIKVSVGDKIKQGDIIMAIENSSNTGSEDTAKNTTKNTNAATTTEAKIIPISVPDIGDFDTVEVIEILVNVGDELTAEDSIITLESDKASMEIPLPIAGVVTNIAVKTGDKVSLGDLILELQTHLENPSPSNKITPPKTQKTTQKAVQSPPTFDQSTSTLPAANSHASPSIRKLARELGADLSSVVGSGQKGRVLEGDLKAYVKQIISGGSGSALPKIPAIDFSKFGETQTQPLSRINKLSSKHLSACWLNIPHVTQFDEVNITEMEAFRQAQKLKGIKLTPLVFIMKAVVQALKKHSRLNASLDESGENLLVKKYFNLGIAVDTPNGLVVPVVRDVEQKSLSELAEELSITSTNARAGKLKPADIQGASFTVSSLGGIGGTQFTPIINAPEVAILGVSRSRYQPIWNGKKFIPTLMLPLALSYDHRVIDGAQGGRFMADLNSILVDIKEILL